MKVHPFKIPKSVHESFLVQVDKSAIFYERLHQHEEIQISCIVNGTGKLIVADSVHPYSPNDVFVIGSHCPHVFQSAPGPEASHMITLFFTETTFGNHFFEIPEMEQLLHFFDRSDAGFRLKSNRKSVKKILFQLAQADKFSKFILFLKLLKKLGSLEYSVLTGFVYPKKISPNEGQRMQTVFDYVMKNFHKDITLEAVSQLAYMTPSAFCRFFKQRTNKTFFQFLIELRVEHACQLLAGKATLSIAEISEMSGFRSISNFNRKFRKLKGLTPSAYFHNLTAFSMV